MVAAWIAYLRGGRVTDADADRVRALAAGPLGSAVPAVLGYLAPDLATDTDLIAAITDRI
jgi:hypothetical protein